MNNHHKLWFKKAVTLAVIIGGGISLTGCGKKTTSNPRTVDTNKQVELTIWRAIDDSTILDGFITEYQQKYPNVKIKLVKKDLADYESQSLNALAEGNGPDIWSIPNDWLPKHYKKLIAAPDNFFDTKQSNSDFYKQTWVSLATKENVIEDKVYGIPLFMDTLAIYVNTDKWSEARALYRRNNENNPNFNDALFRNGPATWNDLLDEVPYLAKKDDRGNLIQPAIDMGTSNNVPFAEDILSLLMMQNGTKMTDESQRAARFNTYLTDANNNPVYSGTNALDFYTSFAKSDKANYGWNSSQGDALKMFIDGKLPLLIGYQYYTQILRQQAPTLNYEVFNMPQVKGAKTPTNYGTYWTETVTNNSRNASVAWDFVATLGLHPNYYLSVAKRPSALMSRAKEITYNDTFATQVLTANNWHKGRYPDQVNNTIKGMIDNVINKKQPSQTSVDGAATLITELLQKE